MPPYDVSIPHAIMAMQFDRIRPDAFTKKLLTYYGKHILDVPDRGSSPYFLDTVFVATTLKTENINLSPTFILLLLLNPKMAD